MGCDIHFYVEKKSQIDGKWESMDTFFPDEDGYLSQYNDDLPWGHPNKCTAFYNGRNYNLFAILADVRNGVGFAGCDTGNRLVPISKPKGLPSNVSSETRSCSNRYGGDGHSHSYLTVAELMAYDWTQISVQRGVVNPSEYIQFKLSGKPESWCGSVSGGGIQNVSNDEMEDHIRKSGDVNWPTFHTLKKAERATVYTRVQWEEPYYDVASNFLSGTLPRLWRLGSPSDVRIVFFFDN